MSEDTQIMTDAGVGAALAAKMITVEDRIIERDAGEGPNLVLLRDDRGNEKLFPIQNIVGGVPIVRPGRVRAHLTLETVGSLAAYANRFSNPESTILASITSDEIVAILNYHQSSRDLQPPVEGPNATCAVEGNFLDHRAVLKLSRSLEWVMWTGVDGKLMPQLDFCRFLEENREDIRTPDAATILEACRDLQGLQKVDFRSVVREDSDNYRIEYSSEADARPKREGVTMPSEFVLGLPVYFDDEEVEVRALLRWKIDDGKLSIGVKLKRAERIRQAQFKKIVLDLAETTGLQALYGSIGAAT